MQYSHYIYGGEGGREAQDAVYIKIYRGSKSNWINSWMKNISRAIRDKNTISVSKFLSHKFLDAGTVFWGNLTGYFCLALFPKHVLLTTTGDVLLSKTDA